jgi:hypothetical protein
MTDTDDSGYDLAGIIKNDWPAWSAGAHGEWVRRWTFEFKERLGDVSALCEGLSDGALRVEAAPGASPYELRVATSTTGNHLADAIFFHAFYELFRRLEAKFGELRLIQGQPRSLWRPFR